MTYVTIDFETKSACDLKKCGAAVYSEHPTTDVTFLGYSFDGGEEHLWGAGNFNAGIAPDPYPEDLFEVLARVGVLVVAHGCFFEKMIWANVMEKLYGWPSREAWKWLDTMAICAMKAIPLDLKRAGSVLGLEFQKTSNAALHKIMKPQKVPKKASLIQGAYRWYTGTGPSRKEHALHYDPAIPEGFGWNNDPALYAETGSYCKDDIASEDSLLKRTGSMSRTEHAVWELDQTINERGVQIDLEYVSACEDVVAQACVPLAKEFAEITGGLGAGQRDKVLAWFRDRLPPIWDCAIDELGELTLVTGEEQLPNMTKPAVAELMLREDLSEDVVRALEIRSDLTSVSVKKIDAMRRSTCADGRARGLLQYHAATTGRWGGRLIQPQNFPRGLLGKVDPQELVDAIMSRNMEFMELVYGASTVKVVASSIRHGIIAAPGKVLCVGDFSSIEARIVLALAGQHDRTAQMADTNFDVYNEMASLIFGFPVNRKSPEHAVEGQVGKNTVLGCGFQMGPDRFQSQVKEQTGLVISKKMAKDAVSTYRTIFAPRVPQLWYGLEDAAMKTVWDRCPHEAFGITYALHDLWLTARLPSGRLLWYFNPQKVMKTMPWSTEEAPDIRPGFTYQSMKTGQWKTISAYGGQLTENYVQGLARDLMVDRVFAIEFELGYPTVLTVHDEDVSEVEEHRADPKAMEQVMCDAPPWAVELKIPVQAECWVGERYRK